MGYLREYVDHLRWRGVTESSIDARLRLLVRLERFLGREAHTASLDELRAFLAGSERLAPRTRYGMVSHLGCYWRWLVLEGHVHQDPTLRLARPKLRRLLPRPVAGADVRRALKLAPTAELRAMVALAAYAGLRCQEIAGLDRRDLLERRATPVIHVVHAKGGRERVVPMHPIVRRTVGAVRRGRGPLFVDTRGRQRTPGAVSRLIREHLHGCGIEASAHQLRHWFGTEVYEASHDLRLTQELLGHASPTTTAGYTAWAQDKASGVVGRLAA